MNPSALRNGAGVRGCRRALHGLRADGCAASIALACGLTICQLKSAALLHHPPDLGRRASRSRPGFATVYPSSGDGGPDWV
jgi:hypothetical protein